MIGFILYTVIVLAAGFFGGMMAKHIIDKDAMREAALKNRALRGENAYLHKIQKGKVIEIHDDRIPDAKFGGF